MVNALWYMLFLVVWGVLTSAEYRLLKPKPHKTKLSVRDMEAQYLFASIMLYVFVLLLARFSTLLISGVYFLSAQIDILLRVMSGESAHGRNPSRYLAERLYAWWCFSVRHLIFTFALLFAGVIISVAYPVIVGIVYFSNTIPSPAATLSIIRITLLLLFIGSIVITLPTQIGAALSENMSSPARRRFLISSLASIAPQSVVLTTFLWTFSSTASKGSQAKLVFRFTYSPIVLAILAAYFAITLLLPYLIGVGRCSNQRDLLESHKKDALTKAIHILRIPLADSYVPELSQLTADLSNQYENFIKNDNSLLVLRQLFEESFKKGGTSATVDSPLSVPAIDIDTDHPAAVTPSSAELSLKPPSSQGSTGKAPQNSLSQFNLDPDIYRLAIPEDPRFLYLEWLDSRIKELVRTASDLQAKSSNAIRIKAARAWAESYEGDGRDLSVEESETKPHTLVAVVASTAITTAASVFFTGFGSWLWSHAAQNLPK